MYQEEYKRWLAADLQDADLNPELSKIEGNDEEIKDRFAVALKFGDVYKRQRIDMAQIAAQELKEIGMDVSVEIPAQTDWAGQMAFLIGWGSRCV